MVPSSADTVLQNRRISQSEISTINICDVNIMAPQHARVSGLDEYHFVGILGYC